MTCAEAETCCQTPTGLWGCCPFADGICCDDGIHCCAKNQICLANGTCANNASTNAQIHVRPLSFSLSPFPIDAFFLRLRCRKVGPFDSVTFPVKVRDREREREKKRDECSLSMVDGTFCPDGSTCCSLASGRFGCCPIRESPPPPLSLSLSLQLDLSSLRRLKPMPRVAVRRGGGD